ncbi:MAG: hypothetical protein WC655_28990, partial [Candidatus Hydrogenedentales bacterium]
MRPIRVCAVVSLFLTVLLPRSEALLPEAMPAGETAFSGAVWVADDIVVVHVGEAIEVAETWVGDIKPGEHLEIPAIQGMTREEYERLKSPDPSKLHREWEANFDAAVVREVKTFKDGGAERRVNESTLRLVHGTLAVLLLGRAKEGEKKREDRWIVTGDGHRYSATIGDRVNQWSASVAWGCENQVYFLACVEIPGPPSPRPLTNTIRGDGPALTLEQFKEMVFLVRRHRHDYDAAMTIVDSRDRIRALKPMLDPALHSPAFALASTETAACVTKLLEEAAAQGGDKMVGKVFASLVDSGDLMPNRDVLRAVGRAGSGVVLTLLRMSNMPAYGVCRSDVYTALGEADRKTFSVDYAALLEKERAFWVAESPRLTNVGWLSPPQDMTPVEANSWPLACRHYALIALLRVVNDNVANGIRHAWATSLLEASRSSRLDNSGAAKLYAPGDLESLRETARKFLAKSRPADAFDLKVDAIASALGRMQELWNSIPDATRNPGTGDPWRIPEVACGLALETIQLVRNDPSVRARFVVARVYDSLDAVPESYRLVLGVRDREDDRHLLGELIPPTEQNVHEDYRKAVNERLDRDAVVRVEGLRGEPILIGEPEDQVEPEMAAFLQEWHRVWRATGNGGYVICSEKPSSGAGPFADVGDVYKIRNEKPSCSIQQITDALEKPIVGAEVKARWTPVSEKGEKRPSGRLAFPGEVEVGPWVTDEQGKVDVALPDETLYVLEDLVVTHPDYGSAVLKAGTGEALRTVLVHRNAPEAKSATTGRVIDSDGKPVEKALLELHPAMEWSEYDVLQVLTDADGRFRAYPLVSEKYLKSHNNERPTIEGTAFGYDVFAPERRDLVPRTGLVSSQSEEVIAMEKGYFHTFTFVDNDGPISRDRLDSLCVSMSPEEFTPES